VAGGPSTSAPEDLTDTSACAIGNDVEEMFDVLSLCVVGTMAPREGAAIKGSDLDGTAAVDSTDRSESDSVRRGTGGKTSESVEVPPPLAVRLIRFADPSDVTEVIPASVVEECDVQDCELSRQGRSLLSLPIDMLPFSRPDLVPRLD